MSSYLNWSRKTWNFNFHSLKIRSKQTIFKIFNRFRPVRYRFARPVWAPLPPLDLCRYVSHKVSAIRKEKMFLFLFLPIFKKKQRFHKSASLEFSKNFLEYIHNQIVTEIVLSLLVPCVAAERVKQFRSSSCYFSQFCWVEKKSPLLRARPSLRN